jgi:hypothetical protein
MPYGRFAASWDLAQFAIGEAARRITAFVFESAFRIAPFSRR